MKQQTANVKDWQFEPDSQHYPLIDYRLPANGRLVSYSQPAPGISITTFLQQAQGEARFFWEDVRDQITFTGFGVAANLMAWGKDRFHVIEQKARTLFHDAVLLNQQEKLAAPRLFGGFAFRPDFVPDNAWSVFHPAHFVLPHYQLMHSQETTWLTINALIPLEDDPVAIRSQLQEALQARLLQLQAAPTSPSSPSATTPASIHYPMSYPVWQQMITRAVHQIKHTQLDKVVLSRVCEVKQATHIDVDSALTYLNEVYGACYRFLFEPRPHHAFLGATPELLAKVDGRSLTTMALAGSIGRGQTDKEDDQLGHALINSAKDRHEHQLVVMALLMRLASITNKLEIAPQPAVYKLPNIQHLFSPVRAKLQTSMGILPIVERLHPTPALGGSPRHLATQFLQEAEPVPRGWYAAPVGWIDAHLDGVFAVAIRSAVTQEKRAWLYAGGGIVADSEPTKEWDETALKFKPMLAALGIEG